MRNKRLLLFLHFLWKFVKKNIKYGGIDPSRERRGRDIKERDKKERNRTKEIQLEVGRKRAKDQ